jgi:hypothetical protein
MIALEFRSRATPPKKAASATVPRPLSFTTSVGQA